LQSKQLKVHSGGIIDQLKSLGEGTHLLIHALGKNTDQLSKEISTAQTNSSPRFWSVYDTKVDLKI